MRFKTTLRDILPPYAFSPFALLGLLCVMLVACEPSPSTTSTSDVQRAIAQIRPSPSIFPANAQAQAATLLNAIEQTPNATALGNFAKFAHAYSLFETASDYYALAAQQSVTTLDWPYLRGIALSDLGDTGQAVTAFEQAFKINDRYPPLRLRLAQLLIKQDRTDEGHALLTQLVADQPDYPEARWALGQFELDRGEHKAAINQLVVAVQQVPHYGSAHYALATAYRATGDEEKAAVHRELFNKHSKSGPPSVDRMLAGVQNLRATSQQEVIKAGRLAAAGNFAGAIKVFLDLLEQDPNNVVAHINLIGLYGETKDIEKATSHYQAGLKIAPDSTKLHNNFGVLQLKQKNYAQAAEAFRASIKADPDYATPYMYLGLSLQHENSPAEAKQNFRLAYDKDPLNFQAGYLLGSALLDDKQFDEAITILSDISRTQSAKTSYYLRSLGQAYYHTGDTKSAADTLRRARSNANVYGQTSLIQTIDSDLSQLDTLGDTAK